MAEVCKKQELLKEEIISLIESYGYDPNNVNDLRKIAYLTSRDGMLYPKISWMLSDDYQPKDDILFALANMLVKAHGEESYRILDIDNPLAYEAKRLLSIYDYIIKPDDILLKNPKFRRSIILDNEKSYLSSIPDIFWDTEIPFEEAIKHYHSKCGNGETMLYEESGRLIMLYGTYNYQDEKLIADNECTIRPDALRYRLFNFNASLRFKSIDSIRHANNSVVYVVLHNGNYIELTNSSTQYGNQLAIENYFDYDSLFLSDSFLRRSEDNPFDQHICMDNLSDYIQNPTYKYVNNLLSYHK